LKSPQTHDFLDTLKAIVSAEISNESFGVSELAEATNMSRSNLLRKIKKLTGRSASQYIRQIRLGRAKELLEDTEMTVSEIAFEVGFSNASYFIKCFREEFGFPPGETRKQLEEVTASKKEQEVDNSLDQSEHVKPNKRFLSQHKNKIIAAVSIVIIAMISYYLVNTSTENDQNLSTEKSIAVLPFKNMSADSTNLYFVNGLMEASLGKLQKIKDLRVVSRTSVEKYRTTTASVSAIGEALNVRYIVEGSGQKNGDEVLLNIQLIDARSDTPVWTEQYQYKLDNVFELQNEVAKKIATAIEANITPNELVKLNNVPTESVEAYDAFLKGLEKSQAQTEENLLEAIAYYDQAIQFDKGFALAYAQKAIAYYYLDEFKVKKNYTAQLNENADKALLYDSKSDISLIAKALYYISNQDFNLAVPHLEKALEYNPNSAPVVLILSELYSRAIPDTSKYLKYALLGVQLNIAANDSVSRSYAYLNLSNSFIQTGFVENAEFYINKATKYNPDNPYVPYLKAFIDYAEDKDLETCIAKLKNEWQKDTTRLDVLQEIGKLHYYKEDYKQAYAYYEKFNTLKSEAGIAMYPQEDLKIGIVYEKMGLEEKAKPFIEAYKAYCYNDTSIYQPASLAMLHIYEMRYDEAIAELQKFSYEDNFQYWLILFIEEDPLMKQISAYPKYDSTVQRIKDRFWKNHEETKKMLEDNGLL